MKKVVDNFDQFAEKLFEQPMLEDEFYFLQILVRGKDGNAVSGNNKNRLVRYYTITSAEQLLKMKDEVIALCRINNARAYIHPTKRSFHEVANLFLELTARTYVSQNWKGMKSLYSTCCGQSYLTSDKKFIVDLDDISEGDPKIDVIKKLIYRLRGHGGENSDKVFMLNKTKSGYHLITWPFDLGEFSKIYPDIDVHKNNPTLLYFEWEEEDKKDNFDPYSISAEYGRSSEYK